MITLEHYVLISDSDGHECRLFSECTGNIAQLRGRDRMYHILY